MKEMKNIHPSGYSSPDVDSIELQVEGVICDSGIQHTSPLPSWTEEDDELSW